MGNEYYENQKHQRQSFKDYRKHMRKLLLSVIVGLASAFAIPWEHLYNFLLQYLSEYAAASATFWVQFGIVGICGLKTIYHTYKAAKESANMDNLQNNEEDYVSSVLNENSKLNQKIDNLEKKLDRVITESRENSDTYDVQVRTQSDEEVKTNGRGRTKKLNV